MERMEFGSIFSVGANTERKVTGCIAERGVNVSHTSDGPQIGIFTSRRADGVDLPEDVLKCVREHGGVIVHHNHLSQESLSDADWLGLIEVYSETFAHCADGTIYWGHAIDRGAIARTMPSGRVDLAVELAAINELSKLINLYPDYNSIGMFFRKEVINRAMRIRGFVEYEYVWGTKNEFPHGARAAGAPASVWGRPLNGHIDEAARIIAPTL
jgi:hypothetical protein